MPQYFDWKKVIPQDIECPTQGMSEARNELDVERELIRKAHGYDPAEVPSVEDLHIDDLLRECVERKGSDLHITVGLAPVIRVDGELTHLQYRRLEENDTRRLVYDVLSTDQLQTFERTHELDFAYGVKGIARFRFNVYMQRGTVAAAMRVIPSRIPSYEDLRLPSVIRELPKRSSGLILVTGPTGSGKSTTIATMIDDINTTRTCHIITIEDPIEYLHTHKGCMVNQREVGHDTDGFHNALRAVLREDPDVIRRRDTWCSERCTRETLPRPWTA